MAVDPELDLVNQQPDEVCVLVRSTGQVDPRRLYEDVRAALNSDLRRILSQPQPDAWADDEPLANDLAPAALRQRFGRTSDVLQPLERPGIGPAPASAGLRPPLQSLNDDSAGTTHHFYYAVGDDRVDFHPGQLEERSRRLTCVRELVNLLNHAPTGLATAGGHGWTVLGGAPNWLAVAAQFACGSPAGLPRAEPRGGRWRFRFEPAVEAALSASAGRDRAEVVVAILDTAPHPPEIPNHGNQYLADLLRVVRIHDATTSAAALHPDHFTRPEKVEQYWDTVHPWWFEPIDTDEVSIADHGLFVAGIIHDIAPDAEIHLIRVLNDTGVGDALGLGHVLANLPADLGIGGRRRLVVNLSLGATIPVPPRRYWARWLPATHAAGARSTARPQPDSAAQQLLQDAHRSLFSMMGWLERQGVLVVAAAGNDALRPQTHEGMPPPPRYPARYQTVFAVAASGPDGAPATYSNRADVRPLGNGITSFGGEIGRDGAGVIGVYTAPTFPGGGSNATGWAQWAGTSFATPIVTGVAARLWARDNQQQPPRLMQRIRSFAKPMASGAAPDPDPDGALDAPLLAAWQEYISSA
jgi:hypothetical protein